MRILPIDVTEIGDAKKLEERATKEAGEILTLDAEEIIGKTFDEVDNSIRAILVKRECKDGAVRVFASDAAPSAEEDEFKIDNGVWNVQTGPKCPGYVIIVLGQGEHCRLFGAPTVQYFRPSGN